MSEAEPVEQMPYDRDGLRNALWPADDPAPADVIRDPKHADASQAKAGDRRAFVRLVHSTARLVLATIALNVRDPHLADDLTQETFLRAWRAIGSLADPGKFNAWLLSIAHTVCVDHHRSANRQKRAGDSPGGTTFSAGPVKREALATSIAPESDPLEAAQQSERRDKLIGALHSLPPMQREVLALRYLAGADYATIAKQLSLTDGALRGHLHRGLAALRERLGEM